MDSKLIFLHAITPLHAGTGQGFEGIDLPIARERATGLPLLPGSTVKGCLKDHQRQAKAPNVEKVFGPYKVDEGKENLYAGAISVSDGQMALFPVRSLAHSFLWLTCPFVLQRLRRACGEAGVKPPDEFKFLRDGKQTDSLGDQEIAVHDSAAVLLKDQLRSVVLEEFNLTVVAEAQPVVDKIATWFSAKLFPGQGDLFVKRFAVVNDANFFHLTRQATEVRAHVAIDHGTGTVVSGALWYQESLPAETVLVSFIQAAGERRAVDDPGAKLNAQEVLKDALPAAAADGRLPLIQFGGKSGTGLGWTRVVPVA